MSYLLPYNRQTIYEESEMFAIKNSMMNILYNFSAKIENKYECRELVNMAYTSAGYITMTNQQFHLA